MTANKHFISFQKVMLCPLSIYKVRGQGAFDLKIKEFTVVNDCSQIKCNEEIGLYGQTLINFNLSRKNYPQEQPYYIIKRPIIGC